jgi:hypothetical protein
MTAFLNTHVRARTHTHTQTFLLSLTRHPTPSWITAFCRVGLHFSRILSSHYPDPTTDPPMMLSRASCLQQSVRRLTSVLSPGRRTYSTQENVRFALLNKIYAPFKSLSPGTPEYEALAASGPCWENFFKPFEWTPDDERKFGILSAVGPKLTNLESSLSAASSSRAIQH